MNKYKKYLYEKYKRYGWLVMSNLKDRETDFSLTWKTIFFNRAVHNFKYFRILKNIIKSARAR